LNEPAVHLKSLVRTIPDFPKPGILFRDITTLLSNPAAFQETFQLLISRYRNAELHAICGIESRGFLIGAPLALELGIAFVPIRKPGKLPAAVERVEYSLEYGTDSLEIHKDALQPGQRVLLAGRSLWQQVEQFLRQRSLFIDWILSFMKLLSS
jgi:adenine phosphoribosyltransferase